MKEIFSGVSREGKSIFTTNLVPEAKVYGERLVNQNNIEYREWEPTRSKLGAAILNGLKELPIKTGSIVLYLGASTGTTVSHVSDIVKKDGLIYAVEFSERVFHPLFDLSAKRKNIAPIMADARKSGDFYFAETADVVYVDIADPEETTISINCADEFLKKGGYLMIAIKSQSIDVTKRPETIYREESAKLKNAGYEIVQIIDLEPYEQKHAMIVAKK
jgi:fibrillarin-like pre-rRNA processing protein